MRELTQWLISGLIVLSIIGVIVLGFDNPAVTPAVMYALVLGNIARLIAINALYYSMRKIK